MNGKNKMKVIILAGGKGTRIPEYSGLIPNQWFLLVQNLS